MLRMRFFVSTFFVLVSCLAVSQTLAWTTITTGTFVSSMGSLDDPTSATLNSDGSLYMAGTLQNQNTSWDWAIQKYNSSGAVLWQRSYNGTAAGFTEDRITGMTVNQTNGDLFVIGFVQNSTTNGDWRVTKYNSSGTLQWWREFAGTETLNPATDRPRSMIRDSNGDLYITGYLINTSAGADWFTVKLNGSTGATVWSLSEKGTGTVSGNIDDEPVSMRLGSDGLYITGYVRNTGTGRDWRTVKYSFTGTRLWTKGESSGVANEEEIPAAMTLTSDSVIVTGSRSTVASGQDTKTVKYAQSNGSKTWDRMWTSPGADQDSASSVFTDSSNNVYVAGQVTQFNNADWLLLKYNSSGTLQWSYTVNSVNNAVDTLAGVSMTSDGNLLLVGNTTEIGGGTVWRIRKITPTTSTVWETTFQGAQGIGTNMPTSFLFDSSNNIYVTGFVNNFSYLDWATLKLSSSGTQLWNVQSTGSIGNSDDRPKSLIMNPTTPSIFFVWGLDNTANGMDWALRKYTQP